MSYEKARPRGILIVSVVMSTLGLIMLVYWAAYVSRGLPLEDIPLVSEILTALGAIAAAYGLYRLRRWGYILSLVVAGMWIYAVVNGIFLLVRERFAVASPIGSVSDFFAFVLTLVFSVFLIRYLWKHPALFE